MRNLLKSLAVLTLPGLFLAFPGHIEAQSQIVISPARIDIVAKEDESSTFELQIINNTSRDLTFKPVLREIDLRDQTADTVLDEEIEVEFLTWTSFPEGLTIGANSNSGVTFSFIVNDNVIPGSYHFGLFFRDVSPKVSNDGTVNIAEIGIPVFIDIPGEVINKTRILSFGALPNPIFTTSGTFETLIENQGNYHITPRGVINIRPILSIFPKASSVNFNDEKLKTLRDRSRSYTTSWNTTFGQLGVYEAEVILAYGPQNSVLTATTQLVIIPWYILVALAGILLLLFRKVLLLRRRR